MSRQVRGAMGKRGEPRRPVSRVLYPAVPCCHLTMLSAVIRRDGDHLSSPPNGRSGHRAPTVRGTMLPSGSSGQPGDGPGTHSPPIRPCSRWGLAVAVSPQTTGRSYRPISPLSRQVGTVCFCATFRPPRRRGRRGSLGVTQHPAQRSPDFPPRRPNWLGRRGGHPVYLALHKNSSIAS